MARQRKQRWVDGLSHALLIASLCSATSLSSSPAGFLSERSHRVAMVAHYLNSAASLESKITFRRSSVVAAIYCCFHFRRSDSLASLAKARSDFSFNC